MENKFQSGSNQTSARRNFHQKNWKAKSCLSFLKQFSLTQTTFKKHLKIVLDSQVDFKEHLQNFLIKFKKNVPRSSVGISSTKTLLLEIFCKYSFEEWLHNYIFNSIQVALAKQETLKTFVRLE